ncbi:MAG: TetR/AcrR family transcriptional regulator [Flavobacteriales bacterium]|jgi:AcrR family transcriptional regulator|nr:TetR/AcrR family transcriptional regulator [Flavobacteriales bacterium]
MGRKTVDKKRYVDKAVKDRYTVKLMVYFQNNGLTNASMSELAKELGISKTTLYNHFKSKEEMVEEAVKYKLKVIGEYQSVIENITLPYTERYRKSMLFFCVQTFDISSLILSQLETDYPSVWKRVQVFIRNVMLDLISYYEIGIDIGVFKKDANPLLLSLNDQQFFDLLANKNFLKDNNIKVLDAFNHHYSIKFNGLIIG